SERAFYMMLDIYDRSLRWALRCPALIMVSLLVTVGAAVYLFVNIPKDFVPRQDNGLIWGGMQADRSVSFQLMEKKIAQLVDVIRRDPAVANVDGFYYGGSYADVFVVLKPLSDRQVSAEQVTQRVQSQLDRIAGASVYLWSAQDVRIGGRASDAQYQFTLKGEDANELYHWAPKVQAALKTLPALTDVNLDRKRGALEINLIIDRATAARFGLTASQIDNTLYDAFGQRQVSVIYKAHNQYHVVMEVAPEFWQSSDALNQIFVSTGAGPVSGTQGTQPLIGTVGSKLPPGKSITAAARAAQMVGSSARNVPNNALANSGRNTTSTGSAVSMSNEPMVPLSAFSRFEIDEAPYAVYHQDLFAASTISFNLVPGVSLGEALAAVD